MAKDKTKYDFIKNLLKTVTYAVVGTVGTVAVQMMGEGMDIKTASIYGCSFGILAGVKNAVKYLFGIDLDLTKMKA